MFLGKKLVMEYRNTKINHTLSLEMISRISTYKTKHGDIKHIFDMTISATLACQTDIEEKNKPGFCFL